MKTRSPIYLLALFLSLSLLATPASAWFFYKNKYASPPTQTITEIVADSEGVFDSNKKDFDILLNAVLVAGLEGALADTEADLTVFAPDDGAFIKLAQDLGYDGGDEEGAFGVIVDTLTALGNGNPVPILTNILLYHVSPGERSLRRILKAGVVETLLPNATILPVFNRLVDNDPEFRDPKLSVWKRGIKASNGVIYKIDRVLIPLDLPSPGEGELPTITETVLASGGDFDDNHHDYDILLNAVLAAGLEGALADPEAELTVFAPKDYAFIKLARDLGYSGSSESEAFSFIATALTELGGGELVPILTDVLLYHVVPEKLTVKQVVLSEEINTLLVGGSVTPHGISLVDKAPALRNPKLILRASNLLTGNGRIHTINRVLIPVAIP